MPRLLGAHKGPDAALYRQVYRELAEQHGLPPARTLKARLLGLAAVAYVVLQRASGALADAQHERDTGKGRRPGEAMINRLRRQYRDAADNWGRAHDAVVAACVTRAPKAPPEPAWKRKVREEAEQRERTRQAALSKLGRQPTPAKVLPSPQGQDWAISPDVAPEHESPPTEPSPGASAADAGGSPGARVTSAEAAGG